METLDVAAEFLRLTGGEGAGAFEMLEPKQRLTALGELMAYGFVDSTPAGVVESMDVAAAATAAVGRRDPVRPIRLYRGGWAVAIGGVRFFVRLDPDRCSEFPQPRGRLAREKRRLHCVHVRAVRIFIAYGGD